MSTVRWWRAEHATLGEVSGVAMWRAETKAAGDEAEHQSEVNQPLGPAPLGTTPLGRFLGCRLAGQFCMPAWLKRPYRLPNKDDCTPAGKKIRWAPRPPRAPCAPLVAAWDWAFVRSCVGGSCSSAHPFGSWCAARLVRSVRPFRSAHGLLLGSRRKKKKEGAAVE
jgi:hypothetical protein